MIFQHGATTTVIEVVTLIEGKGGGPARTQTWDQGIMSPKFAQNLTIENKSKPTRSMVSVVSRRVNLCRFEWAA